VPKNMNEDDCDQIDQFLEIIKQTKPVKMVNLLNLQPEYEGDQGLFQPCVHSISLTHEVLKLYKIIIKGTKSTLSKNLKLIKPETNKYKNEYKKLYVLLSELEFIENLLFEHFSGQNTWIMQKCPKQMF
jgi:hypothetical protein